MSLKALAQKQKLAKQEQAPKGVGGGDSGVTQEGSIPSPADTKPKRSLALRGKGNPQQLPKNAPGTRSLALKGPITVDSVEGVIESTPAQEVAPTASATVVEQESSPTEVALTSPQEQPLTGEIPATECDRDLPEDMTKEMAAFIKLVDRVPSMFHDPELMGQTLRRIMSDQQENPEFSSLLSDVDVKNIIKGFKDTLGGAQIKKEATKKKSSNRKTKPKLDANDMGELDNLLESFGIG